jgi:hypothetical protein
MAAKPEELAESRWHGSASAIDRPVSTAAIKRLNGSDELPELSLASGDA